MTPKRESQMMPVVRAYFERRYEECKQEVPFYEHRIDLYGYSSETDRAVAVELKLRKWRRAIEQALIYQLCSDYVFIAVPATTVRLIDLDELRSHGIGLLAVSADDCVEKLPAVISPVLNPNYKAAYRSIIKE